MPISRHQFPMFEQVADADADEDYQDGYFYGDNRSIEIRRLLDSYHQHQSAKHDRQEAQQVKCTVGVGQSCSIDSEHLEFGNNPGCVLPMVVVENEFVPACTRNRRRQFDTEIAEQADEISAPAGSHRGRAESVLQHQVPADDPGKYFT